MNLVEVVNRGEWRRFVDHDVIGMGHTWKGTCVSRERGYGMMKGVDVGCG